jgi:hypothetical protein
MAAPLRFARFSPCGRYRYWLSRLWSIDAPPVTFVMLNSSDADASKDDPTTRRCMGFARDWGYGGVVLVNLYAWCATKPRQLWRSPDPVGPENDRWLAHAAQTAAITTAPIVAAWGANARPERVAEVLELPGMGRLTALGFTRSGAPRHPLYVPADTPRVPFLRFDLPSPVGPVDLATPTESTAAAGPSDSADPIGLVTVTGPEQAGGDWQNPNTPNPPCGVDGVDVVDGPRGSPMIAMTEPEALAEGLRVLGPDGVPNQETPAERADRCARMADELAAVVDSMLAAGRVTRNGLNVILARLGELHVDCDQLAEDFHHLQPQPPWEGVA